VKTKPTVDDADSDSTGQDSGESDYTYGASEQQEQEGVLDANGRLTVTLPRNRRQTNDQDYRH